MAIWETGQVTRAHWPAWLLMAAAASGLCALVAAVGSEPEGGSRGGAKKGGVGRGLFILVAGVLVGLYAGLEFFPK